MRFAGDRYRNYMLIYRPGCGPHRPGRYYVASAKHPDDMHGLHDYDLRDADEVETIQRGLEQYPPDLIDLLLADGEPLP